ncbi:N-acetylmuramoyl-L-alanine amidase [Duffyella gerundensis]|uniref:N-acetylmuramoyl-L-alanine amidase n=1 Tax=Duffyella gerundensis TaxID=1619313 RepID=UPI001653F2DC|nr:N-acetylmuramoyl-L-alanine amidase [Duffyella gerundensis]
MRIRCLLLALFALAGCQNGHYEARDGYAVDKTHPALGARPRVKVVVLHYTAEDLPSSLATLTDREVSAHYLIPAHPSRWRGQPAVWQLVPESQLAWHAGPSFWRGATRLNDTSIGIELVNPGYRRTSGGLVWQPYTPQQIAALTPLLRDIVQRYSILPVNIVGHSDVAPQRKQDPGPLFPWQPLASLGLGAWPAAERVAALRQGIRDDDPALTQRLLSALARYGYGLPETLTARQQQKVIAAFQMHFRPADYRGIADAETLAIAEALLEKYGEAE